MGRLFVSMALLYPWATKEYLLWEMSLGQIILYHNIGIEIKYPKSGNEKPRMPSQMTPKELERYKKSIRDKFGPDAI